MKLQKVLPLLLAIVSLFTLVKPIWAKVPVMVMSDFGEDPDDEQSMVRFLFSNEFDVRGLLVTADPSDGTNTIQSSLLRSFIDSYGNDLNNLRKLDPEYPSATELKAVVKDDMFLSDPFGGTNLGTASKYQTDAVKHIISEVDKTNEPIWFLAWGGARPISQALYTVKNTRSAADFDAFVSKVRVHAIFRQDNSYDWVYGNAPKTFWIYDGATTDKSKQTFRGMYLTGDTNLVSSAWVSNNISNHGSLSGRYPASGAGVSGIKEGDTPSFLFLLNPTLNNPEDPTQGGWGGRYQKMSGRDNFYVDLNSGARETVSQWRQAYQNAFSARLNWAATGQGNKSPEISVWGNPTKTVSPGEQITLDARGTFDTGTLTYEWKQLGSEDSYGGSVSINNANTNLATLTIPSDAADKTIHVLLTVTDSGSPQLSSYQRYIFNVNNQPAEPTKIMALGDSITQSNNTHNSYRRPLWKLLENGNYNVDFVGSLNTNYNGGPPVKDFDLDHEGHWGWEINEVLQYIDNWASANTPDVVLIHLGTNDVFAGQTTSSSITELGQLIDKLRSHNSSVKILLAQPINHNRSDKPSIKPLVDAIPQLASKSTSQSPIYIVDMYTGFDAAANTFDSVHPNETGEAFMANRWYAVLSQVLDGNVQPSPVPTPSPSPEVVSDLFGEFSTTSSRNYHGAVLNSGQKVYSDRDFTFTNVPEIFQNLYYFQTPNDDKQTSDTSKLVQFKAYNYITVYVAYTPVNTTLTSNWLTSANGWSDVSATLGTTLPDDEATRYVKSKNFAPGETVILNGNGGTNSATSMYNIIIASNENGSCNLVSDLNGDKVVDGQDYALLSNKFLTSDSSADLSNDGIVDSQDYAIMSQEFLQTCN